MRAAFLTDVETLEVGDADLPDPKPGEVELAVAACGICGSNLHAWRHPELTITKEKAPAPGAAGHEVAAIVARVGDAVEHVMSGDLVVIEPNLTGACRTCDACAIGTYWFCRERTTIPAWGFAERMVVPAGSVFAVPSNVSADVATLAEPLACGVHAVRTSTLATAGGGRIEGVRVAVLGAGVTGLLAVAAARALGAESIAITARYPHQAKAARAVGADDVIEASAEDSTDRLRSHRPQLVIEAVGGTAQTFELAIRVADRKGEVAVLGLFDERQSIDARRAVFRELRVFFPVTYGVTGGTHDFDIALEIIASDPESFSTLITHSEPLVRVDQAFRTAADKSCGTLRVVVKP